MAKTKTQWQRIATEALRSVPKGASMAERAAALRAAGARYRAMKGGGGSIERRSNPGGFSLGTLAVGAIALLGAVRMLGKRS